MDHLKPRLTRQDVESISIRIEEWLAVLAPREQQAVIGLLLRAAPEPRDVLGYNEEPFQLPPLGSLRTLFDDIFAPVLVIRQ